MSTANVVSNSWIEPADGTDKQHAGYTVCRGSHLEQENVLSTVAAVYGELTRSLLAGDDVQLGGEGCNGDHRLACYVSPRHRQLQSL